VVAYVDGTPEDVINCCNYKKADGSSAITVVCIFAANLNVTLPDGNIALSRISVPEGYPIANANPKIASIVRSSAIEQLKACGIKVLLTILGNHDAAGWSNFKNEKIAQNFAQQLADIVTNYDLDGIDIDDEYSKPDLGIPNSLVMVTTLMRGLMPDKIISKALWADLQYFGPTFGGNSLADTLTNGWFMGYGSSPSSALPSYVGKGMDANALSMGFWTGQSSGNPQANVRWLKENGYGGVMVFAFQQSVNQNLAGLLVNALYDTHSDNANKSYLETVGAYCVML
jgi:hypothetical protein